MADHIFEPFDIPSIFINNPQGDKYSVIWCLYDPGKLKELLVIYHWEFFVFPITRSFSSQDLKDTKLHNIYILLGY